METIAGIRKTIVIIGFYGNKKRINFELFMLKLKGWKVYYCSKNKCMAYKRKSTGYIDNEGWHIGKYWKSYWPYGIK